MDIQKRIERFNRENAPFYMVAHCGEYSLCLLLGAGKLYNGEYGQYAFDAYAVSVGKPVQQNGWYTYGDGCDWECVFKKAFQNDARIKQLTFDSESSGLFIYCEDMSTLESLGSDFKSLCEDRDAFTKVVVAAMQEADLAAHARSELPLTRGTRELREDEISFADEVYETDGALDFYMESFGGEDEVFGTHVCTDENDDYLNIYADYDLQSGTVADTLTVVLHLGDGVDVCYGYQLSEKEKSLLLPKMASFYLDKIGESITETRRKYLSENQVRPVGRIDFLGSNGEVGESITYTNAKEFIDTIQSENLYGAPISVTVFRQEDGSTLSLEFLKNISSPIHGCYVEDVPPISPEENQGSPALDL